jgi:hypothetical protein
MKALEIELFPDPNPICERLCRKRETDIRFILNIVDNCFNKTQLSLWTIKETSFWLKDRNQLKTLLIYLSIPIFCRRTY